eukprot:scaffold1903_cov396-Prasinococcus_capsulatus_cf.AAC.2
MSWVAVSKTRTKNNSVMFSMSPAIVALSGGQRTHRRHTQALSVYAVSPSSSQRSAESANENMRTAIESCMGSSQLFLRPIRRKNTESTIGDHSSCRSPARPR